MFLFLEILSNSLAFAQNAHRLDTFLPGNPGSCSYNSVNLLEGHGLLFERILGK